MNYILYSKLCSKTQLTHCTPHHTTPHHTTPHHTTPHHTISLLCERKLPCLLPVVWALSVEKDLRVSERVNAIFSDKAESEVAVNRENVHQPRRVGCGTTNIFIWFFQRTFSSNGQLHFCCAEVPGGRAEGFAMKTTIIGSKCGMLG